MYNHANNFNPTICECIPYRTVTKVNNTVSDALRDEISQWRQRRERPHPILINAPTGRGKSTFIFKDLAKYAADRGQYILLLSNRKALKLQQMNILAQNNEQSWNIGNPQCCFGKYNNIFVLTYQQLLNICDCAGHRTMYLDSFFAPTGQMTVPVEYLVLDEAHFFAADSTFNPDTYTIFKRLLERFKNKQRIYMSATLDNVKSLIIGEETKLLQNQKRQGDMVNFIKTSGSNEIIEYHFPPDYSWADLHFFTDWDEITARINDSAAGQRWLIFVSSKEEGKELKSRIRECDVKYIDATHKDKQDDFLKELVVHECFPQKVLITTCLLDNGINFFDSTLKNIVVDSTDRVQMIQMIGRKRRISGEIVNVYIRNKDKKQIAEYQSSAKRAVTLWSSFKDSPRQFYHHYWGYLTESQQRLFSIDSEGRMYVNELAKIELSRLIGQYDELGLKLASDHSAFCKEVCSWFGKEYDPSMGEPQYDRVKRLVQERLNKAVQDSPLDLNAQKSLHDFLIKSVKPFSALIGIRDEDGREKSNIDKISKYFSLPYACLKRNNQWVVECKECSSAEQ